MAAATYSSVDMVFKPNKTAAAILNNYVNEPEPLFDWKDTGYTWETRTGGTAYLLNVTSL